MSTSPVTNGNGGTEQKIRQQEEQVRGAYPAVAWRSRPVSRGEMMHAERAQALRPALRRGRRSRCQACPPGARLYPADRRCEPGSVAAFSLWRAGSSGLRRADAVAFCVHARRRVCARPRRCC